MIIGWSKELSDFPDYSFCASSLHPGETPGETHAIVKSQHTALAATSCIFTCIFYSGVMGSTGTAENHQVSSQFSH